MMLRYFIIIVFTFLYSSVYSQKYIHGEILDAKSEEPINDVSISITDKNRVVRSSSDGVFTFNFPNIDSDMELKFDHVGYKTKSLILDKYYRKRIFQDTIFLKIRLREKATVLPDFIVNANRKPDTIYGSRLESVEDFMIKDKKLILLTYDKTLRKESKIVIKYKDTRQEHLVPDLAKNLFTDYNKNTYVVCEKSVYEIVEGKNDLFLENVDSDHFYNFIARINDSTNQKYYYSDFQDIYPAFTYYSLHLKDSSVNEIHSVEDKFMMELYRSEYKYVSGQDKLWALRQEMKTGIDKEIWIGVSYFTSSLYYKSLYAPTVMFDDVLHVFDHYSDYIYKVDINTDKKTDSVSISYHLINGKEKWKQPMIFDEIEKKAYALFQKGGQLYLRNIDLETGKITESFKIHYRFVERIKVVDGKVYYVYRPFESSQKKFIYSERIG